MKTFVIKRIPITKFKSLFVGVNDLEVVENEIKEAFADKNIISIEFISANVSLEDSSVLANYLVDISLDDFDRSHEIGDILEW